MTAVAGNSRMMRGHLDNGSGNPSKVEVSAAGTTADSKAISAVAIGALNGFNRGVNPSASGPPRVRHCRSARHR